MRVTDHARVASGTTLLFFGHAASFSLFVLSQLVGRIVPGFFGSPAELALQALWLGVAGVVVAGLVQVALGVDAPLVPWAAAAFMILDELASLSLFALRATGNLGASSQFGFAVNVLFVFAQRGLVLWVLASLSRRRYAWAPVLGVLTFAMTVLRWGFSMLLSLRFVEFSSVIGIYGPVSAVIGLVSGLSALSLAYVARRAVHEEKAHGAAPEVPPQEQGLHAPVAAEPPASLTADFAIGAVILLIGVVVTLVSVSAASNGGRYLVATGAIGVGLGRIIRGFVRLARR